ncbi:hypothetical protein HPP92_023415 [Vanilla planifolia]|uniref:Uncharacterized protein n=1 Tax=Vanilla planifolia TaxID=51239 RepID=A0A835Q2L1_VANPL|nr:hypothetical protein HPP92_023415 [Vanilla planifolia]
MRRSMAKRACLVFELFLSCINRECRNMGLVARGTEVENIYGIKTSPYCEACQEKKGCQSVRGRTRQEQELAI